ncbi:hypothetical protein BOTBODRAFT_39228 [Botryobasidium botryosum FD-172 SS1]|uniref:Uncharacterized protein n=1 Tax=Botryobasidium botryosum (strain FD-172 SS1) TaxID=930990 RepID=A0A067M5S3_BOTB1|nr:hypothetical protein BOTBODRAFT_39228 [Botryobasidium botryosum FD-172 SS1]
MTPLRNHPFVASTTLFFIGWPEIFIFVFLLVIVVYFTAMLCIIGFATGAIRERSPTGAFQSSYFAAALPVQAFVGLARSSGFKGILPTWVKISPILGVFSALLLALGTYILYGEFVDL